MDNHPDGAHSPCFQCSSADATRELEVESCRLFSFLEAMGITAIYYGPFSVFNAFRGSIPKPSANHHGIPPPTGDSPLYPQKIQLYKLYLYIYVFLFIHLYLLICLLFIHLYLLIYFLIYLLFIYLFIHLYRYIFLFPFHSSIFLSLSTQPGGGGTVICRLLGVKIGVGHVPKKHCKLQEKLLLAHVCGDAFA